MTVWAIVPVKPLRRGKSRLSEVLTEDERAHLNRKLFVHTLEILKQVDGLEHVLVVSRDPEALALARDFGARTLQEDGAPHLNVALARATMVARTYKALAVLILPADLPQLAVADVDAVLAAGEFAPVVAIAPDVRGEGTNALLVNPAGLIEYDFGDGSFERHKRLAVAAGAALEILDLPGFAHDVDLPADLVHLNGHAADWLQAEGESAAPAAPMEE